MRVERKHYIGAGLGLIAVAVLSYLYWTDWRHQGTDIQDQNGQDTLVEPTATTQANPIDSYSTPDQLPEYLPSECEPIFKGEGVGHAVRRQLDEAGQQHTSAWHPNIAVTVYDTSGNVVPSKNNSTSDKPANYQGVLVHPGYCVDIVSPLPNQQSSLPANFFAHADPINRLFRPIARELLQKEKEVQIAQVDIPRTGPAKGTIFNRRQLELATNHQANHNAAAADIIHRPYL